LETLDIDRPLNRGNDIRVGPTCAGVYGFLNGAHVAIMRLFSALIAARIAAALKPQPRLHQLVIVFEDDYYLNK
jgi:hypothetical protein